MDNINEVLIDHLVLLLCYNDVICWPPARILSEVNFFAMLIYYSCCFDSSVWLPFW